MITSFFCKKNQKEEHGRARSKKVGEMRRGTSTRYNGCAFHCYPYGETTGRRSPTSNWVMRNRCVEPPPISRS